MRNCSRSAITTPRSCENNTWRPLSNISRNYFSTNVNPRQNGEIFIPMKCNPYTVFFIDNCCFVSAPDAVENVRTTTRDSNSILVQWDPPSSINMTISGYYVYYTLGTSAQTQPLDNTGFEMLAVTTPPAAIEGLTATQSYRIQVQAVTTIGDLPFLGVIDTEVIQVVNTTVNAASNVLDTGMSTLTISLPRPEEYATGDLV